MSIILSSRELAKLAGVSHVTVCRAFRNDPSISDATRSRILKLAKEHGYQPNPIFTQQRRKTTPGTSVKRGKGNLAFVHNNGCPGNTSHSWNDIPYFKPILDGLKQQASEYGFSLNEFYVGPLSGGLSTKRFNSIIRARGILGVVAAPPQNPEDYEGINWQQLIAVTLTHSEQPPNLPRIAYNNLHRVNTCLQGLHELGYRRIGLCAPEMYDRQNLNVWSGGMMVHHHRTQSRIRQPLFTYPCPHIQDVASDFLRWVREQQPDALLCIDRAVREILESNRFHCPEDIGLAHSAVDQDVADWTGYKIDRTVLGNVTLDLLMTRMMRNEFGLPETRSETLLRGEWVLGTTTQTRTPSG